jgi:2-hydroxycyclohexanecarboxyl-CoA dehydrogenase
MTRFEGKVVVVTGGGGGIGGATSRRFAAEGAKVAVFDLNLDAARKVAAVIAAAGGVAEAFACDIANRADVDAAVAAVEARLGPIDVLVNNAGLGRFPALRQDRAGAMGETHRHQSHRRAAYAPCRASRHGGAQKVADP